MRKNPFFSSNLFDKCLLISSSSYPVEPLILHKFSFSKINVLDWLRSKTTNGVPNFKPTRQICLIILKISSLLKILAIFAHSLKYFEKNIL